MSANSKIEWTDSSWNPIRGWNLHTGKMGWHCEHVSEGCRNCYAERMNLRLGTGLAYKPGHRADAEILLDEKILLAPMHWRKPRRIFVGSMTDLFADFVTDEMLDKIFAAMALSPHHTFQILTKRPERMREYLTAPVKGAWAGRYFETGNDGIKKEGTDVRFRMHAAICDAAKIAPPRALNSASLWQDEHFPHGDGFIRRWPLPSLWLGVSVEDQETANARIPILLDTPAAIRFISAEPLLGPVILPGGIDWVIAGGESGPGARPSHTEWFRSLRDQCAAASVPYFFKQWGEWAPTIDVDSITISGHITSKSSRHMTKKGKRRAGRLLDGVEHNGYPEPAQ